MFSAQLRQKVCVSSWEHQNVFLKLEQRREDTRYGHIEKAALCGWLSRVAIFISIARLAECSIMYDSPLTTYPNGLVVSGITLIRYQNDLRSSL